MAWVNPFSYSEAQKQISYELIRRNKVDHLLTPKQVEFRKLIEEHDSKSVGYYASRRSGKTMGTMIICFYMCLKYPKLTIRFVLGTSVQARDVIMPIARDLAALFPEDLYPRILKSEGKFEFGNGSVILLGSSNSEHCERLRGNKSDIIVVDEAGFHDSDNWSYAIYSLLAPQLLHSNMGKMVYTTTPPPTPAHSFFVKEYPRLKASGAIVESTIWDNILLTPEKIEAAISLYIGGKDSPDFRREHLLEMVADTSRQVVPEFNEERHVFQDGPWEIGKDLNGSHLGLVGIFSGDVGIVDWTAVHVCYLDTYKKRLVVCEERILRAPTLTDIAEHYKEMSKQFRGKTIKEHRILDCFAESRHTLWKDHGIQFLNPLKRSVEDSVGVLRELFATDRILIHSSCKHTIEQLKFGLWSETKAKDFSRENESLGHLDAIASLMYAARKADLRSQLNRQITLGNNGLKKPLTSPVADDKVGDRKKLWRLT